MNDTWSVAHARHHHHDNDNDHEGAVRQVKHARAPPGQADPPRRRCCWVGGSWWVYHGRDFSAGAVGQERDELLVHRFHLHNRTTPPNNWTQRVHTHIHIHEGSGYIKCSAATRVSACCCRSRHRVTCRQAGMDGRTRACPRTSLAEALSSLASSTTSRACSWTYTSRAWVVATGDWRGDWRLLGGSEGSEGSGGEG